jgi:hypothetical protein
LRALVTFELSINTFILVLHRAYNSFQKSFEILHLVETLKMQQAQKNHVIKADPVAQSSLLGKAQIEVKPHLDIWIISKYHS